MDRVLSANVAVSIYCGFAATRNQCQKIFGEMGIRVLRKKAGHILASGDVGIACFQARGPGTPRLFYRGILSPCELLISDLFESV